MVCYTYHPHNRLQRHFPFPVKYCCPLSIQYSIFMFFATHAITCSHPLGLNLLTEQAETCRIVLDICDQHEAVH